MEIDAVLGKNEKRNYFYAAFTIRKAREEAVGDRLIALVWLFLEKMSKNSQKWRFSRRMSKSVNFLIVLSTHAAQE